MNVRSEDERSGDDPLGYEPTLPAMVAAFTENFGDLVQVVDGKGERRFRETARGSSRVARGLLGAGLAKAARIGVLLPNGADFIEAFLGVTRVGGHAVLLSTLAKPRELAFMIRHSDINALIVADRYLSNDYVAALEAAIPALREAGGRDPLLLVEAPFLRSIWVWGDRQPDWSRGDRAALERKGECVPEALLAAAEHEVAPSDPAILIYTSGSTAEPKGVIHSHDAVVRQSWRMSRYMTYQPGDRLMTTQPFFWVGGLCTSLLAANHCGATIVCPERPSIEGMLDCIHTSGVTNVALWPPQMRALLAAGDAEILLSRLKPTSAQQLGLFGLAPPERTPNALGMTETLGPHSMELPGQPLPADRVHSFGRVVGDFERKIIDPETGRERSPGETGELLVRGGSMMLGFHRRLRTDVFESDSFYRTGDMASIDEGGHLYFVGRGGDMIKVSGANVSPREVEEVLMKQPEVAEAAVLALADASGGESVVAVVVPRGDATIDEGELVRRLREELASYKVPRRLVFLSNDEIPRTASEKIRKPQLAEVVRGRLGAS
jgi:acyl-coenzyme A synthetase/AMP-(fatty) acid ligase